MAEASNEFRSRLELRTTYSGGEPDLEEAYRILRSPGLANVLGLRQLMQARSLKNNACLSQDLDLEVSSESCRGIQLVSMFSFGSILTSKMEVELKAQENKAFRVQLKVNF